MLRYRVKIKALPFLLFIIIGIGPIALDGFSQLFSYWATSNDGSQVSGLRETVQQLIPLRESTPALRALTGAIFGFIPGLARLSAGAERNV